MGKAAAGRMDFKILELLGFGGTGLATTAAVLALFWKADDAFSGELREALSKKLQGLQVDTKGVDWPQAFVRMFDRVFGKRHLTWKCFGRSCLASAMAVPTLAAVSTVF